MLAGKHVEIFSFRVKHRVGGIVKTGSDLFRFFGIVVVNENSVMIIFKVAVIGQVAAVGRPT